MLAALPLVWQVGKPPAESGERVKLPLSSCRCLDSVRGGEGLGTPGTFDFLPLRHYRPDNSRHVELANVSRQTHAMQRTGRLDEDQGNQAASIAQLQHRVDESASNHGDNIDGGYSAVGQRFLEPFESFRRDRFR
jgi:hypothetical protein